MNIYYCDKCNEETEHTVDVQFKNQKIYRCQKCGEIDDKKLTDMLIKGKIGRFKE